MKYTWGVDGHGRALICNQNGSAILCCLVAAPVCVADLEEQDARVYASKYGMGKAMKVSWMRQALLVRLAIKVMERMEAKKAAQVVGLKVEPSSRQLDLFIAA